MTATRLLIEGVSPDDISSEFLTAMMDAAEDHGIRPEGISIPRRGGCQ